MRLPRTAAKYSNLCALRLPWASIHIRAKLPRLTVSSVAPVVCIQTDSWVRRTVNAQRFLSTQRA
jgi:hypothetical protein